MVRKGSKSTMRKVRRKSGGRKRSVPVQFKEWRNALAEYRASHPRMGKIPKRGSAAYAAIKRNM